MWMWKCGSRCPEQAWHAKSTSPEQASGLDLGHRSKSRRLVTRGEAWAWAWAWGFCDCMTVRIEWAQNHFKYRHLTHLARSNQNTPSNRCTFCGFSLGKTWQDCLGPKEVKYKADIPLLCPGHRFMLTLILCVGDQYLLENLLPLVKVCQILSNLFDSLLESLAY